MLTKRQVYTMLVLRRRENNIFSVLPEEIIDYIGQVSQDPNSDIAKALHHAAYASQEDVNALIAMLEKNPRLLLEAGNVVTPGGLDVRRVTIYECLLGAGDPEFAKMVEPYFEKILDNNEPIGEEERKHQYERYRPHIEALAKEVESKQSAFDLNPLFDCIKQSSPEDIRAALNKDMQYESVLRDALIAFRNVVRPTRKTVGMHYEHYSTLQQAFDLLDDEWQELSSSYTNYDKCDLVWRQIIGYLQLSLPAVDRFAFAHAFKDKERTANFIYADGSFPCTPVAETDMGLTGPYGSRF